MGDRVNPPKGIQKASSLTRMMRLAYSPYNWTVQPTVCERKLEASSLKFGTSADPFTSAGHQQTGFGIPLHTFPLHRNTGLFPPPRGGGGVGGGLGEIKPTLGTLIAKYWAIQGPWWHPDNANKRERPHGHLICTGLPTLHIPQLFRPSTGMA